MATIGAFRSYHPRYKGRLPHLFSFHFATMPKTNGRKALPPLKIATARFDPMGRMSSPLITRYFDAKSGLEVEKKDDMKIVSTMIADSCDAHGPKVIREHVVVDTSEDAVDVDFYHKVKEATPTCPIHKRDEMQIKEMDTKYGPAQLHHCPHQDCPVSCFGDLPERNTFLDAVARSLHWHYRDEHCPLECFCGKLLALKLSKSEKNKDRLFFTCKYKECNMFQWADDMPHYNVRKYWQNLAY